jgi:hypothetical protein
MFKKFLSKIKFIFINLNYEINQVNKGLRDIRENGSGSRCTYF